MLTRPHIALHYELMKQINMCWDEEKKIRLCLEDVGIAEEFAAEYNEYIQEQDARHAAYGEEPTGMKLPRYPSFQALAIYYQKHGQIEEAIEVCEQALKLGFTSDTMKGGTAARLEKLKKVKKVKK